ncbi:LysR family transcriptional regulator [Oceanospirillum sediminis]|uniref:LysR family transcriptional regulator n=1 Tax=Oceanospirillum sediminis TaxID=2760088 RepID=A0A839IKT7_9GAMM|nr:LysR family transcriptional regulator [Oceanospirillum sediminis]MBB1485119.1 LysR family transcriptional regulator [Oceanospirillum sediminis]
MYSIAELETFVAVARRGGITAAAHHLGISAATTSHRISKLEKALKLVLFHRNSRFFTLTDEGSIFLEKIERILEDLHQAEMEAGACSRTIKGHLRVTLSPWILTRFILPNLPEFQEKHPRLSLEFSTADNFVPLAEEGQDCAIRVGRLPDSSLVARRICDNDRLICASPELLERIGTPQCINDLESVPWVCLPWQTRFSLKDKTGAIRQLVTERNILMTHSDSLTEAALQGIGVAVKSRLAICQELAEGRLVEILPGVLSPSEAPIWFITLPDARNSRKISLFSDMVFEAFKDYR